jgi:hypothetical protein
MKSITILILILLTGLAAHAQNINPDSIRNGRVEYYFQIQSGALVGCSNCSNGKEIGFSGSTTHGVKLGRKLRIGAGVGLDSYYEWNIVPLFGSISWDLFGKKNALFAELNYGEALASRRHQYFQEYGYAYSKGGQSYSFGLGYRIKYDRVRISCGIARKTQFMTSYYEYPTYYWNNNDYILGEPSNKKVNIEMNRLVVWIAVGLN